jgi:hypothetical protein
VRDDRDPAAQGEQDDAQGQWEEVVVPEGLQGLDLCWFHLTGGLAHRDDEGAVDGTAHGEDDGPDERDAGEHSVLAITTVEHRSQEGGEEDEQHCRDGEDDDASHHPVLVVRVELDDLLGRVARSVRRLTADDEPDDREGDEEDAGDRHPSGI